MFPFVAKEEHFHSNRGVIKSPNFPYGYFSRSEIYMYSVQAPAIDTNMTLLVYDWDLNASAGSKITVSIFLFLSFWKKRA
jgi:hypothetical protein